MQDFFLPVAAVPQWALSRKVAQLLCLRGPWWHQVCRDMDCLCHWNYGPIRVFFQASYSWESEGLFGQSFSVALPIQALKGLPYLASLSVVPQVRHIEGSPWVGSYSVVQCIRRLMGQPLYCSAADAGQVFMVLYRVGHDWATELNWTDISFSTGQVLLHALSWWCACTSVSEGVFLMYPWREMYSTSTYSSTILFSPTDFYFTWSLCLWRIWSTSRIRGERVNELSMFAHVYDTYGASQVVQC